MSVPGVTLRYLDSDDRGSPSDKIWSITKHRVRGDLETDKHLQATGAS